MIGALKLETNLGNSKNGKDKEIWVGEEYIRCIVGVPWRIMTRHIGGTWRISFRSLVLSFHLRCEEPVQVIRFSHHAIPWPELLVSF